MFDEALKNAKKASFSREPRGDNFNLQDPLVAKKVEQVKPKKKKSSGKRTDPNFKQVGAYIRKDTYLKIQKLLLEQPDKNFSDLVEELLTDYLTKHLSD